MQIVSKKRWSFDGGIADYTECVVACGDHTAVLGVLRGYRLRAGQPPTDPQVIFGLFDLSQPHWPVALIGVDGRTETVSIQTLH